MAEKYWYKIETSKDKEGTYHYHGSSPLPVEELIATLKHGDFIRLDELLYMERGVYKEWAEWDKTLVPAAYISASCILSVMQYKSDPRTIS